MNTDALEVIGTGIAGGGGLVGLYLLIRALWKLISGQLAEQRNLLKDAREGTDAIARERDNLRARIRQLNDDHETAMRGRDQIIEGLRKSLNHEAEMRRKWTEYASELRAMLIEECGKRPSELPPLPHRNDNR